jgi:hypothetical protein
MLNPPPIPGDVNANLFSNRYPPIPPLPPPLPNPQVSVDPNGYPTLPIHPPMNPNPAIYPSTTFTQSTVNKWDAKPAIILDEDMRDEDPRIEIRIPSDQQLVDLINLMAKFVASDGEAFEKVRMGHGRF